MKLHHSILAVAITLVAAVVTTGCQEKTMDVSVAVVDQLGAPIAGAAIGLYDIEGGTELGTTVTSEDGIAHFTNVPKGLVNAQLIGTKYELFEKSGLDAKATAALESGGTLEGTIIVKK